MKLQIIAGRAVGRCGTAVMLAVQLLFAAAEAPAQENAAHVTNINNSVVKYWVGLAYHNLSRKHYRRALNAFERALMEAPDSKEARFGLSSLYIHLEEYEMAMSILQELKQDYPDDYSVNNNIAWLYATAKDPAVRDGQKAISYAREALVVAPGDYHVWNTLSEAYYVYGEYEKAMQAAQEARRIAGRRRIKSAEMQAYIRQYEKCRKAVQALSLIE